MRCLKRRLSDVVYRALRADALRYLHMTSTQGPLREPPGPRATLTLVTGGARGDGGLAQCASPVVGVWTTSPHALREPGSLPQARNDAEALATCDCVVPKPGGVPLLVRPESGSRGNIPATPGGEPSINEDCLAADKGAGV